MERLFGSRNSNKANTGSTCVKSTKENMIQETKRQNKPQQFLVTKRDTSFGT